MSEVCSPDDDDDGDINPITVVATINAAFIGGILLGPVGAVAGAIVGSYFRPRWPS